MTTALQALRQENKPDFCLVGYYTQTVNFMNKCMGFLQLKTKFVC